MEDNIKHKPQKGRPRRTTCKDCEVPVDNSDMTKKSVARCASCALKYRQAATRQKRKTGPVRKDADWRKTRRTTCKFCGLPIDNSDLYKEAETRCVSCKSKQNMGARKKRVSEERKHDIELTNSLLLEVGYRICSKCLVQKKLEEFSNSLGKRATTGGKIHKLCDLCLDKHYSSNRRPDSFTHTYLRKRAYGINCRVKKRMELFTGSGKILIDELPSVVKPQDLVQRLEEVRYLCYYCGTKLLTSNTTFDHKRPLGLSDTLEEYSQLIKSTNLAACCTACNHLKHTRTE